MSEEHRIPGTPASGGHAFGAVHVYRRMRFNQAPVTIDPAEADAEIGRFRSACTDAMHELGRIAELAGSGGGDIITTHIEILRDPELRAGVESRIRSQHLAADSAVWGTFEQYLALMRGSGNPVFRERMVDLEDVRDRLLFRIRYDASQAVRLEGQILVADDCTPTELVEWARQGLKGLVLQGGGRTSHASIIARSLGIPKLVAASNALAGCTDGVPAIVDAETGWFVVNPSEATRTAYRERMAGYEAERARRLAIAGEPARTACGEPIVIRGNIEFEDELPAVRLHGAEGIGLLRTESFFLTPEGEGPDAQIRFYEAAVHACDPHPVTIRLFDVGGDKVLDNRVPEANPFLGWRGVRILLDRPELLRTQLHAIHTVAARHPGRLRIMIPMVADPGEVEAVRREWEAVAAGTGVRVPIGIMVETPAAAIEAAEYARISDFFSLGTNDLTQYTLAVDRGNPRLASRYPLAPTAVMRLVDMTVEAATAAGIEVAVCGELAADPESAAWLVGLGVRELSMAPASVPAVKEHLRRHTLADLQAAARNRF